MTDLLDEFVDMAAKAAECTDWLAGQGIGQDIIYRPGASIVGVCRAQIYSNYWQPDPDGKPVLVSPVTYETAACCLDPIDLVAWQPGARDQWYLRTGHGAALGEDAVGYAGQTERPLVLHETPADWLMSNGEGCCILDWRVLPMEFRSVERFHCPSLPTALRLEQALMEPTRKYEILYPGALNAA